MSANILKQEVHCRGIKLYKTPQEEYAAYKQLFILSMNISSCAL